MERPAFRCTTCGDLHEALPSFGADVPDPYSALPPAEREERAQVSSDLCVIDGEEFFLRGCLEVPIHGGEPFLWGVWIAVGEQEFHRYRQLGEASDPGRESHSVGRLSTRLPCYPDTLLLEARVRLRSNGQRPLVELDPSDHPLALDQQAGLSWERAQEMIERVLHPEQTGAPPVLCHVYREHVAHFGEPDHSLVYDPQRATSRSPLPRTEILIWRADESLDLTTFATIGMSSRTMPHSSLRAELHLTVRGSIDAAEEGRLATLLANMSCYPWDIDAPLDWWHMLSPSGAIPAFPNCSAVLLHPPFVADGWARIEFEGEEIRLLNVVPITTEERAALGTDRAALLDRWAEARLDMFSDRSEI